MNQPQIIITLNSRQQEALRDAAKSCHVRIRSILKKLDETTLTSHGSAIFYISPRELKEIKQLDKASRVNLNDIMAMTRSGKRLANL
jgi:hypothetical protein